jgi:HPr kinase/phosphorylase
MEGMARERQLHASVVARQGEGVILLGPPGAGKSELAFLLIERGFVLVADDRVLLEDGPAASPPPELAGLLEVRGLGIFRLPYLPRVSLVLAVTLGQEGPRLPAPRRHPALGLPTLALAGATPGAALRIVWALDVLAGRRELVVGAFGEGAGGA